VAEIRTKTGRRADLLAAARAILAEKGLEAATVAEIVARAGVAQGTCVLTWVQPTQHWAYKGQIERLFKHVK